MKAEKTPSYNNRTLRLTEIPGDALSELTITIEIKKPEPTANKPSPGAMGVTLDKYVIPTIIEAINKAHVEKKRPPAYLTKHGRPRNRKEYAQVLIAAAVPEETLADAVALADFIQDTWGVNLVYNNDRDFSEIVLIQQEIEKQRGKCTPLAALKTEAGTMVLPETFTYQELARAIIESGVSPEVIEDQIALGAYIHGTWGISLSLNHPSSQMVKVQEAIKDLRAAYSA